MDEATRAFPGFAIVGDMDRYCSTCAPWLLPDPAQLLRDLDSRGLLRLGSTLLVVTAVQTAELVHAAALEHELTGTSFDDDLEAAITASLPADAARRDHVIHLVLCRDRRTVPHPGDMAPWTGWLNASSMTGTCCGEWFLVTRHGWRSLITSTGPCGLEPVAS